MSLEFYLRKHMIYLYTKLPKWNRVITNASFTLPLFSKLRMLVRRANTLEECRLGMFFHISLLFAHQLSIWPLCLLSKAQLTRTSCERLFCSLSDARILAFRVAEAFLWPSICSWAHATATSRSRNCNVAFSSCVSWHRQLDSVFLRLIPESIDGRRWYRLHFTVRVRCLQQLCMKPMR